MFSLYEAEENFWAQRARVNWLQLGDKNTSYFQTQALIRRNKKHIIQIKDDLGFFHDQLLSIANVFIASFMKRFTNQGDAATTSIDSFLSVISPCISQSDNATLTSMEEVFDTLNIIGPLKAPGPDGLHAIFFQPFWPQVKSTIFDLVNAFFANGTPFHSINHSLIALIPKLENPESVSHYRPISLCNVVYKIISKLFVRCLRPLLSKCISPNQGAFALG